MRAVRNLIPRQSGGLECTLPICHHGLQYPSGCTVLEYRFEADRPVARIVQMPTDTAVTTRNSSPLMKTRSSSDSFSRVTSRRQGLKQKGSSIDICSQKRITDKFILLPVSYILKSRDCIDDSIALADKVKVKTASSTILEFDKNEKRFDDSSQICRSSAKNILKTSYCDDKLPKQPMTFVKCITTFKDKDPLIRVTKCSTKTKSGTKYSICSGSKMKTDSFYKIIQPTDSTKRIISDQRARVSSERICSKQRVPCRKSKPKMTYCSPLDGKLACPSKSDLKIDILLLPKAKDSLSQITRKNSLDPSEILSSLKKPSRRYKRRICPANCCCQSVRPTTKDICSYYLHTKSSDTKSSPIEIYTTQKRFDDQRLQRLASEQMRTEVRRIESAKSDKPSACQGSAVAFRHACLIPKRVSEDTLRLPSAQELFARYKDYIPTYQLERYEICRSKRNGLQDECIPPLVRTILKKEEEQRTLDKCIERDRDRLD